MVNKKHKKRSFFKLNLVFKSNKVLFLDKKCILNIDYQQVVFLDMIYVKLEK